MDLCLIHVPTGVTMCVCPRLCESHTHTQTTKAGDVRRTHGPAIQTAD